MKSLQSFFLTILIITSAVCIKPQRTSAQVTVSFQLFYDQLSPYGQWINYPSTGYVWIPNAGSGFIPYSTGGHWVLTEFGWTWVSDYAWGWAPFHYGRWNFEPAYGWLWIPGKEWGPAWVSWRRSPGYYGWVPMGFGRDNDKDDQHWVFVKDRDIDRTDISRRYISRTSNTTIIKNSTVIQGGHGGGPDRDEVQKITSKPVKTVAIQDDDKPGQKMSNGQLRIYRPHVQNENGNGNHPTKVTDVKDVKPQNGKSEKPGEVKAVKSKSEDPPAATHQKIKKEKKKPK